MVQYTNQDPDKCEFITVGAEDDLPNGQRMFVEIDGTPIVVFNIAGNYYAIADICSHDDGPLGDGNLENYQITCPRHGARFDVKTGKALSLPAIVSIPAYPVRVEDQQIQVGIPHPD